MTQIKREQCSLLAYSFSYSLLHCYFFQSCFVVIDYGPSILIILKVHLIYCIFLNSSLAEVLNEFSDTQNLTNMSVSVCLRVSDQQFLAVCFLPWASGFGNIYCISTYLEWNVSCEKGTHLSGYPRISPDYVLGIRLILCDM